MCANADKKCRTTEGKQLVYKKVSYKFGPLSKIISMKIKNC